jgi:hypothetical protein
MNEKDSTTAIYITLYNIIAIFWAPQQYYAILNIAIYWQYTIFWPRPV